MARYLFVGDPHATVEDLADCKELMGLVWGQAKQHGATVILSGDLYHTHAIIHAEVQYFWWDFLQALQDDEVPVVIIKGNHDVPGTTGSKATALIAHHAQAELILYEPLEKDGILFCPYVEDGRELVAWSTEHAKAKTLICHQTFSGSRYENGLYAPDGLDPAAIYQEKVISGHIHSPQEFGKVWYPGAPRWRTLSDANTDRAIWLLDFTDGKLVNKTPIDTGNVCRQIYHFVDTPDQPVHLKPNPRHEYRIDIKGPQSWIDQRKAFFESFALVRTTRTDSAAIAVRESDGVEVAFGKYLDAYKPRYGTDKEVLADLVKERLPAL